MREGRNEHSPFNSKLKKMDSDSISIYTVEFLEKMDSCGSVELMHM